MPIQCIYMYRMTLTVNGENFPKIIGGGCLMFLSR